VVQTRTFLVDRGLATRKNRSSGATRGSGANKHLAVGQDKDYRHWSFLRFADNWTNVGVLHKATLKLYTDDGFGQIPLPKASDTPKVWARFCQENWTEGSNQTSYETGDWKDPAVFAHSGAPYGQAMAKQEDGLTNYDITSIVKKWQPISQGGKGKTNNGIRLHGKTDNTFAWTGWSDDATNGLRPSIEIEFDWGVTVPDTPTTGLVPVGTVASLTVFEATFSDLDTDTPDRLAHSTVQVFDATGADLLFTIEQPATNAEATAAKSSVAISDSNRELLSANVTYQWRIRQRDDEGQVSAWSAKTNFDISNTSPDDPALVNPADAAHFDTLDGVHFRTGAFTDADAGDYMAAYQMQLSIYAAGSPNWDDADNLLWDTGPVGVPLETTVADSFYTGSPLAAGTYYWRCRVYDQRSGVSGWTTSSIIMDTAFDTVTAPTAIQLRPQAPWRIVIYDMGALRGPGNVVAILENAKSIGASKMYNSPGEAHWTLPKDHAQLSVIEPKQTHYSIQFYAGDGWREVYAGLVWDIDAADTDIVFYGIDYLALLDYILDERFDPRKVDKPAENGGSYYVSTGKNSIGYIIWDQLRRARGLANSPVGFITQSQDKATMIALFTETQAVYSTMRPALQFITSLLDSHRAGRNLKSRISVRAKSAGGYEFITENDPGIVRDGMRLQYGEMVQGYRVIPFGKDWATRVHSIGRTREGVKALYKTHVAPGLDESVWGRFAVATLVDGVNDENDLDRRTRQLAIHAGVLGKELGVGIRTGLLQPFDGYDIGDLFPVNIDDGSIHTSAFGSGYWVCYGVTWEAGDLGQQTVTLTLLPEEDGSEPSGDLLTLEPISTQLEWQIGWTPPVAGATAMHWADQNTGIVYDLETGAVLFDTITGTV